MRISLRFIVLNTSQYKHYNAYINQSQAIYCWVYLLVL
nr:MAG TPA: hypothetical protein [Caudoviricetes sp.]